MPDSGVATGPPGEGYVAKSSSVREGDGGRGVVRTEVRTPMGLWALRVTGLPFKGHST